VVVLALVAGCTCRGGGATEARDGAEIRGTRRALDGAELTGPDPAAEDEVVAPGLRLPEGVDPLGYRVALDIDPSADTFHGEIELKLVLERPADHVWVHAKDLELGEIEIAIGGRTRPGMILPVEGDEMVAIDLGGRVDPGLVTVTIDYEGRYHDVEMVGLFRQERDGKKYVYSQLEAVHARKVFPCLDEPGWKVPWLVTIDVPPGVTAVANSPLDNVNAHGDGSRSFHFVASEPLPSYLVAVAVGPFSILELGTVGANRLPLRVIAPAGTPASAAANVRAIAPKVVAQLEAYFARPMPYAKLDLVAVPDFPGAMENAGLITFDRGIVLGGRGVFTAFAAHEFAHQWFGNLVTLRWWDDLWLNESFASWMGAKVVAALRPSRDSSAADHRDVETAMRADASPRAAALRRTIETNTDIEASFDAIAYEKGAAVIAMFEAWLGEDVMRDAIRAYIAARAGGVTDSTEFLDAIERASDADNRAAFASFVDQAGVPLVTVERSCDGATPVIALRQERLLPVDAPPSSTAWRLPVCVRIPARDDELCVMMTGPTAEIDLDGATDCPAWVVGNAGDAGYYRVRTEPAALPPLAALTRRERLAAVGGLSALIDAGVADPGAVPSLVTGLLASGSAGDERAAINLVRATASLVSEARRDAWRRWAAGLLAPVVAKTRATGTPPADAGKRHQREQRIEVAASTLGDARVIAEARARADRWLDGALGLRGGELELVLAAAAAGADPEFAGALLARASTMPAGRDRDAVLAALGAVSDPAAAQAALVAVEDPAFQDDVGTVLEGLGAHAATRAELLGLYADPDRRAKVVAKLGPHPAHPVLRPFDTICDAGEKLAALAILVPFAAELPDGDRLLADVTEDIDRCIARRAALGPALERLL
jgi:alanyl aminopeptidase